MNNNFTIAETDSFTKKMQKKQFKHLRKKINDYVYPQLKSNPFFGLNIKKLKGEFDGVYRYRIGDYRLFYIIENEKVLVIMTDLQARKDSYR